jgi:hypothetical protein
MASKNTELAQEKEQRKDEAFLEEYKALVEPLNEKHGRRLLPIIQESRTPYRVTQEAVFAIDRFKKQVINVDKELNKESSQSKVVGHSDSNIKAPTQ